MGVDWSQTCSLASPAFFREAASASFRGPVISATYFFQASALPGLMGLVKAYEAMVVLLVGQWRLR